MVERVTGRRRRAAWLLPSLGLHAALLGFGAWRHAHPPPAAAPLSAPSFSELDVELLEPVAEASPQPVVEDAPAAERGAAAARPSEGRSAPGAAVAPLAAPPSESVAEGTGEAEAVASAEPDAGGAAESPSRLSLGQLGLGRANPFLLGGEGPVAAQPPGAAPSRAQGAAEKAARVKRRLDHELAQGALTQDTARGRGAGSPVLRSLEAAVYASSAPLNGQASFVFIIDGDGKLLSSSVGSVSGNREAWSRVARQTAQSLAARKLSVPKGKSVRLTIAVSSHLELPSGADPGVAVDVLGLPLKRGGGPRSTKVDLLNPKNPLAPLSLMGDPADIGAKARRMVHAHVVSEELL